MSETTWLYLAPKDEAKFEMMRLLLSHVLIPVMLAQRIKYLKSGHVRIAIPGGPAPAESEPETPRANPRIVLTLDGEDTHLQALYDQVVDTGLAAREGIELVKFCASASKTQQPCDVSPMYRIIKQSLEEDQGWMCPDQHTENERALRMVPSASRATFAMFLDRLPGILSKACTKGNLRSGWALTGLWPDSAEKMLSRTGAWGALAERQRYTIRRSMPGLVEHAALRGEVTEDALDEVVSAMEETVSRDIVSPETGPPSVAPSAPEAKQVRPDLGLKPINYRRAVWLNHDVITLERVNRKAKKQAAEAKKANAALARSEAAKSKVASKRGRKIGAGADDGGSKRRKTKERCANPTCGVTGGGHAQWTPCSTCDLIFCARLECILMYEVHESNCHL
jgi:hypothetical protein